MKTPDNMAPSHMNSEDMLSWPPFKPMNRANENVML